MGAFIVMILLVAPGKESNTTDVYLLEMPVMHIQLTNNVVCDICLPLGVWSGDWGVTFENQCAVKGASVVLKCSYDYPYDHTVTSVNWYKGQFALGQYKVVHLSRLSSPPEFKYVGNEHGDCSLKLYNVRHSDEGSYYFRFATTTDHWISKKPARLSVKGNKQRAAWHHLLPDVLLINVFVHQS